MQGLWDVILTNHLIQVFLIIQIGVIAFGLGIAAKRMLFANLATLLGILGTFIGITIGLLDFDPNDIEGSVPRLIEGLTTAFITSITGIVASIIIRSPVYFSFTKKVTQEGATVDTLAEHLATISSLTESNQEIFRNSQETMLAVKSALIGDEDKTLLTQLQKLRTSADDNHQQQLETFQAGFDVLQKELADGNRVMVAEFQNFAKTLTELSSKSLIEALSEVIRDFNTQLTEQFGENFKELNVAVGRLLEWQEAYRQYIEESEKTFKQILLAIDGSRERIAKIDEHSSSIAVAADQLSDILTTMDAVTRDLKGHLEGVAQLGNDAKVAFPVIEENLIKLTQEFGEAVDASVTTSTEFVEEQSKKLEALATESSERVQEQILNLDNALQQQLTQSLESLGSQLASLSDKFVSDYAPLTEELRRVVRIAGELDNR